MKKILQISLLIFMLSGFIRVHAEDLTEDQLLGLCLVAGGNIAEGSVKGLNDRDSIKKAKVLKKAIFLAKKDQGKDPRKIFASESEFDTTNKYFLKLNLSDKKNVFALCYTGLPPDLVAQLYKEIEN